MQILVPTEIYLIGAYGIYGDPAVCVVTGPPRDVDARQCEHYRYGAVILHLACNLDPPGEP